jgi:membrane protein implicated in regulation of membrane protease activity
MNLQTFWTIATVIFVLLEVFTLGLTSIWFAVGSIFALLVAFMNFNLIIQIIAFMIGSIITIVYARPLAVKYFKVGSTRTNVDEMIGKHGVVEKAILDNVIGQVNVSGQIWSAFSQEEIAIGTKVEIIAIEGVKLKVRKV